MTDKKYKLFRWCDESGSWQPVAGTFKSGRGATAAAIEMIDSAGSCRVQLLIGVQYAGMPPSRFGWEVGEPFDSVPAWIRRNHQKA
jgi:hypothetical protein